MDATLLQSAVWLLALTGAGGLVMALMRFGKAGHNPPSWLAMLHGFLAAAGLTLLVFAALTVGIPDLALIGLILLVAAAGGGVVLNLGYHLKGKPLPKGFIGFHAVVAAIGLAMVVMASLVSRR